MGDKTQQDARDLDCYLAMHLFGWQPVEDDEDLGLWFKVPEGGLNPTGFGSEDAPPLFSTTWEGMGLVVEAMQERGFELELNVWSDRTAMAGFVRYGWDRWPDCPLADTPMRAVALAAKKALEVDGNV